MKKGILFVVLGLVFASVFFVSCSGGKGGGKNKTTIRLMYWGELEDVNFVKRTLVRFEKANPGIKVIAERAPSRAMEKDGVRPLLYTIKP